VLSSPRQVSFSIVIVFFSPTPLIAQAGEPRNTKLDGLRHFGFEGNHQTGESLK
jgi:hypothetical protein